MSLRSGPARGGPRWPADLLWHPVVLGSLILLVLNDHWLKQRYGNFITGKVSDVAGVLFFPLLLVACVEILRWIAGRSDWVGRRSELVAAMAATAVGFGAIQVIAPVAALYEQLTAGLRWILSMPGPLLAPVGTAEMPEMNHVMDPTDLVALPILVVTYAVGAATGRADECASRRSRNAQGDETPSPEPSGPR